MIWSSGYLVVWSSAVLALADAGVRPGASLPAARRAPGRAAWRGARAAGAPTPAPPPTSDVKVETSVDRTAIWVADRVVYAITITCKPNVDVLDDDLAREKLKLDGLEIVGTETSAATAPDGTTTHRYRYTLTTYHLDTPTLTDRAADRALLRQATGPAAAGRLAGRRSGGAGRRDRLPQHAARRAGRLRAARRPARRGRARGSTRSPSRSGSASSSRRSCPPASGPSRSSPTGGAAHAHKSIRQVREQERASLEAAQSLDVTTVDGRREAYSTIDVRRARAPEGRRAASPARA